jgi:hypothetical protein
LWCQLILRILAASLTATLFGNAVIDGIATICGNTNLVRCGLKKSFSRFLRHQREDWVLY